MVPATVPSWNRTCGVAVEFAGMVKVKVRPPEANCTAGSSARPLTDEANVRLNVPFSGVG